MKTFTGILTVSREIKAENEEQVRVLLEAMAAMIVRTIPGTEVHELTICDEENDQCNSTNKN